MSWNTSAMPHTMSDPVTRAGSPMETGSRAGVAPTAPDSYTSTRCGAWVARARLHARLGRPIPTNTTSPSTSSRAATLAIISSGVQAPSEPVIHPGTVSGFRREPCDQLRTFFQVPRPIRHAAYEVVEVALERVAIARDPFPRNVEIVVAVVVPLCVRRVRAPRLDHHRIHDHGGGGPAGWGGAGDPLVPQPPHHPQHPPPPQRPPPFYARQTPKFGVAPGVRALRGGDSHARGRP